MVSLRPDRRQGALLGLLMVLTAGCSSGSGGEGGPSPGGGSEWGDRVDPQILQDVVDATYWVPGPSVRRGMRVQMFVVSIGVSECGGRPAPIDSTQDRPAQNLYPDLELIRDRGFAENGPSYRDGLGADCADLAPDNLESWEAWRTLNFEWEDVALNVQEENSSLEDQKAAMGQCLRDRTGLSFDEADPTTFLLAVDNADIDGATDAQMKGFAVAYADCGQPYFDAFAAELEEERNNLTERNREALSHFAVEIADAGYLP